jgi:hypothetical protein
MNGFIKATVAGLCLGTGLTAVVGCSQYRQLVDPCWPDRYNAEARLSVRETFGAEVHNGHVLDQTVWNYHFEVDPKTGAPTDKLNAAGREHLKYLTRRPPVADPNLFLQTAQDIPGARTLPPDKLAQVRSDLDNKRIAAIQRYLASLMSGRGQMVAFDVTIHDQAEVGIAAIPIGGNQVGIVRGAVPDLYNNYKGKMPGFEGVTITTGGGGS